MSTPDDWLDHAAAILRRDEERQAERPPHVHDWFTFDGGEVCRTCRLTHEWGDPE